MRDASRCPAPEDLAQLSLGLAGDRSWRDVIRHLSECVVCRRTVLLLGPGNVLPEALPGTSPSARGVRPFRAPSRASAVLSTLAAGFLLGMMTWALLLMNRAPEKVSEARSTPERMESPLLSRQKPLPPAPKRFDWETAGPLDPAPVLRPYPLLKDDSSHPLDAFPWRGIPGIEPGRQAGIEATPSLLLAKRESSGILEAIEVRAGSGEVTIHSESGRKNVGPKAYLRPSETLGSETGGSVVLADGSFIHLSPKSEVRIAWSQSLVCYSLDLRKDDVLVDLGPGPRDFHVGNGALGVRLQETSGMVYLSVRERCLRAVPFTPGRFQSPSGENRLLRPQESLLLEGERDALEMTEVDPKGLTSIFPSLGQKARLATPPPPPTPKDPVPAPPEPAKLLRSLAAQGYSYRISGRQLREGSWLPPAVLVSTMEDITLARQVDTLKKSHFQRGRWAWDAPGSVKPGTPGEHVLEILRNAPAPHVQLLQVSEATRPGTLRAKATVTKPGLSVWELTLDPQKVRAEFGPLVERSVREGHLEPPDFIYWETLEGLLEFTVAKEEARLVQALDRRRVSISYNSVSGLDRRWYELETVYEFTDVGRPTPRVPREILKDLDPTRK